jgi:type IV secretory pathway VirB10-like protein
MSRSIHFVRALPAVALLMAPWASGQIYRSVTPDGKVIYSDQPPPDATRTEQIAEPPPPPPERQQEAARQAEDNRVTRDAIEAERRTRSADVAAADQEVREAERALATARKRLEIGRVEQEGDRVGIVGRRGGGARQSDAYLERVRGLEAEVAQAEARVRAAKEAARQARAR